MRTGDICVWGRSCRGAPFCCPKTVSALAKPVKPPLNPLCSPPWSPPHSQMAGKAISLPYLSIHIAPGVGWPTASVWESPTGQVLGPNRAHQGPTCPQQLSPLAHKTGALWYFGSRVRYRGTKFPRRETNKAHENFVKFFVSRNFPRHRIVVGLTGLQRPHWAHRAETSSSWTRPLARHSKKTQSIT
jgi:hypothetical protein